MTEYIEVHTTLPSQDAAGELAKTLVQEQWAACVQVSGPIASVYRWKGELETSEEWACTIKTRSAWFSQVEQAIRRHHPYEVPEIVATPLSQISADYANWLATVLPADRVEN